LPCKIKNKKQSNTNIYPKICKFVSYLGRNLFTKGFWWAYCYRQPVKKPHLLLHRILKSSFNWAAVDWLIWAKLSKKTACNIASNYHTNADFPKLNPDALRNTLR